MDKIISKSDKETKEVAKKIAKEVLSKKLEKRAVVLALKGNLGAGKTTFAQGFAKGLGIRAKILSPTFNIMKRFKIQDSRFKNFYHIDCYRLKGKKDLEVLGFKEVVLNSKNVIIVEWPDKIKSLLPKNTIYINFKHLEGHERRLLIKK
ncbi:MAG: tRNA (adenosine(37)-N6)-threonylcarbamoyltransferase complex ATPase subunit type 1 TsaE [Candidatus Staskawiczbacteria bacterium RIFCSPHIGHO2_02_FULL_34_9]|uniref:tRNA threonylcarbamoyladenosine biosynthesis protein TsaE n=1 Tax=Candidatus Staskawiczbacteria bacterium RIFCSPHIGHO2_02_FULL_34_9 TaxID=1802206 RepID=A0A1G2HY35_9BACT|nr:MAG: tRNA (adenosine(37)-N6)-threonylcarbamoyltransferase complex ATPase subunit type 1 TsaE [Candidatus Staskawiczbacteria bacterium RIFCSPHIGHO2_02_FULL_34_9]